MSTLQAKKAKALSSLPLPRLAVDWSIMIPVESNIILWAMMFFHGILYIPSSYLKFFMKQGEIEFFLKSVDHFFLLILNATTLVWTSIISYKEQYKYTSLTFPTLFSHEFLHSSFSVPFSVPLIYLKSSFASNFQSK